MLRGALVIALALVTVPLIARADDMDLDSDAINAKRISLSVQQAALLDRLGRIDDLGHANSVYDAVRDRAFNDKTGLPAAAKSWQDKASSWLQQWDGILLLADQATTDSAGGTLGKVRDLLYQQSQTYDQLRIQADSIAAAATSLKQQISGLGIYPETYIDGYATSTRAFNQRVAELNTSLSSYEASFGQDLMPRWHGLLGSTSQAVEARLKRMMLQYPELATTLNLAQQAFTVADKIDPAVIRTQQAFDLYNGMYLAKKYFHAKAALTALQQTAGAATLEVQNSGLDSIYTAPAVASIQASLAAAVQLDAQPLPVTPAQMVAGLVHTQQRFYTVKCRSALTAPLYNCELLRTLNKFDTKTIMHMNDSDLRQIEYAFEQVAQASILNK